MINDKYIGNSKSSSAYSQSYLRRIGSLKIPVGYLPPMLQHFHRRDKQHIAHSLKYTIMLV